MFYHASMKALVLLIFITFSTSALAVVDNKDTLEVSAEYGFAYHTLHASQKSNGSEARFTSSQNPFFQGSFTAKFATDWQWRINGGVQYVQYNDPEGGSIVGEKTALTNYGLELVHRLGPYLRIVYFGRNQDQTIYKTNSPNVYEIVRVPFGQGGFKIALAQRRRIGFLWAVGAGTFLMLPTKGGDVVTEGGYGAEAYARLGFVGFGGILYQIKGAYNMAQAPNAEVTFVHEVLSYSLIVSYPF